MTVYIVIRNNKVDAVFDNRLAAEHHCKAYICKWAIVDIIEKEVQSI